MAVLNVIEAKWSKGKGTIGIILIKTQYSGFRAYMGVGLDVNVDYDTEFIVTYGEKLSRHIAAAYFPKRIKEGVMYDGRTHEKPKGRRNNSQKTA